LEIDYRGVDMWELRVNEFIRGTLGFPDRESALEALGLSEQDAHADS
jgi:hypothetical protein